MQKFGIMFIGLFMQKMPILHDFNSYEIYMITEKEWKKAL